MKIFFITLLLCALPVKAKLIDKIAGVINDKTFTLSELQQIKNTIGARAEISSIIYPDKNIDLKEILNIQNRTYIIRDKLSAQGYVISDDAVEGRINETEKQLGLGRADLLRFLKTKNLSFDEYFEVIRETMEFNIFNSKIISPLISISEQELKNFYYKNFSKGKALSFKYSVLDFIVKSSFVKKEEIKNLPSLFQDYQRTGILPDFLSSVETIDLGDVSDDDLPKEFSQVLKVTDDGSFSSSIIKDGIIHTFYVKQKNLSESSEYLSVKDKIYNEIYYKRALEISADWFKRESNNYYIQIHL